MNATGKVLSDVSKPLPDLEVDRGLLRDPTLTGNDLSFGDGVPVRGRPRFVMDSTTGEAEAKVKESNINACRKAGQRISARTGGVFSFLCEHGFHYGYVSRAFCNV